VTNIEVRDLLTKTVNKVSSLADNYPEEEQLHLANQLRYSASVISMGLDVIKVDPGKQEGAFIYRTERIENSLLEIINNLEIALIREYINKNDYDEACNIIEQLHYKLITLKKLFLSR